MLKLSPARVRVLLAALIAGSLPSASVRAQPGSPAATTERKTMVNFSLVADGLPIPSGTFTLGLRYKIAKGWHTYWDGLNDTGMPASWQLELPDGWTAGEAQWPAPVRYGIENGVVDHVYMDEATILIPITVPTSTQPGEANIRVSSKWLVCEEACIPEKGDATLTVKVVAELQASVVPEAIAKSRGRAITRGWGELSQQAPTLAPTTKLEEAVLHVHVPGATKLAFFPGRGSSPAEDLIADGETEGNTLRIPMHQRTGEPLTVRGVIEVTRMSKNKTLQTSWHSFDFTPETPVVSESKTESTSKPATKPE
jgi:hypothetical protein